MANGWDGADPGQENEPGVDYELATRYTAAAPVTVTAVRVWAGLSESVIGRQARIWTTGGVLVETADLDAVLPAGWTTYDLDAPVELDTAESIDVSYSTLQFYGAVAGGYPNASADGLVTATAGRFHATPGTFPATVTASFYGIDIVYTEGTSGNAAPEITDLAVTVDELEATATATVTDEEPGTVAYLFDWGDGSTSGTTGDPTDTHTYAAAGLYAVYVQATDNGGLRDVRAVPVIVPGAPAGMDLEAVATELATRLDSIAGLRVSVFGPENKRVHPPHAIVTLPAEPIVYHGTYNAGGAMTEATFSIVLLLGKVHSRSAYAALAAYASATGARSVKVAIESGVYVTCDDPIVTTGAFDEYSMAGDDYLAAIFDVHLAR